MSGQTVCHLKEFTLSAGQHLVMDLRFKHFDQQALGQGIGLGPSAS
jgi:hypothetical protein